MCEGKEGRREGGRRKEGEREEGRREEGRRKEGVRKEGGRRRQRKGKGGKNSPIIMCRLKQLLQAVLTEGVYKGQRSHYSPTHLLQLHP